MDCCLVTLTFFLHEKTLSLTEINSFAGTSTTQSRGTLSVIHKMKTSFTVFYSWQSDTKSNRNLIHNSIDKALKRIKQEGKVKSVNLELNLDRDTKNKNGSPSIVQTIFNKIKGCDIFIADVTNINETFLNRLIGNRPTPNPNVLIELGFAIEVLGWERIICVNNESVSLLESLPFDIRGHRITNFNSNKDSHKEDLVNIIKQALNSIIKDFEEIITRQKEADYIEHDKNIFNQLQEICSEQTLKDGISLATDSLFMTKYYYHKWSEIQTFCESELNKFIDTEIQQSLDLYLKSLRQFVALCSKSFFVNNEEQMQFFQLKKQKLSTEDYEDLLHNVTYRSKKEPLRNETWEDSDKRIYALQDKFYTLSDNLLELYGNYIMTVKKNLLS